MPGYAEHPGLTWLRQCHGGPAWLDTLDETVTRCARRWSLHLNEPFEGSHVSLAMAVTTATGEPAVLKVDFPDVETELAADALVVWDGDGAVRLLDADREVRASLIERCDPGTPLGDCDPPVALDVLAELLPRLWRPAAPPFRSLAGECGRWREALIARQRDGGQPFAREHVDTAHRLLAELPGSQGEQVLLHQDLHGGNVLRAQRQPWLAIDPKPLTGEREFALSPVIRSFELGEGREQLVRRLDHLTGALGLDRHRAACWTYVHTVAWNLSGGHPQHLEAIEWLRDLI
jgi:streptomycin 6-kinase